MSSSGKTQNFELNQWVGSDPVLREDFNADNAKLDAHVHDERYNTKQEISTLMSSFAKIHAGTVTATSNPVSSKQLTLSTPFEAKAVIFLTAGTEPKIYVRPCTGQTNGSANTTCVWGTTTFKWYYNSGSASNTTVTYTYLLLG